MTRAEIRSFFERREGDWSRHDAEALARVHREDGVLESPIAGTVKGRAAIEKIYSGWFASFPDVEFKTEQLLIDGTRAAHFTRMSGTHAGEFCGLLATGRRFEVRCAFMFEFADGQISHEIRVYDFTGLLVQLGVLKTKPAF